MEVKQETPPVTPPVVDPPKPGDQEGEKKSVSYESHRQLLDEKKKLQKQLDDIAADKAAKEAKAAEENGEFKKLLETERAAHAEAKAKLAATEVQEAGRRKLGAILNGAGGTIDRKWFGLLDAAGIIDGVTIDATTGEVDPASVAKAVAKLKTSYPEIIVAAGGPKTPNGDPAAGGGAPAGKIAYADWLKLSSRDMDKWRKDQIVG